MTRSTESRGASATAQYDSLLPKHEALLRVTKAIASHREICPLLEALALLLHSVVEYDSLLLVLYDPETDTGSVITPGIPVRPLMIGGDPPALKDGLAGEVWKTQKPIVAELDYIQKNFSKIADIWARDGFRSVCAVPLITARHQLGVLEFLSARENVYTGESVPFIEQVASQVAIAIDSALNWEKAEELGSKLQHERDRLRVLLEVSTAGVASDTFQELLESVFSSITHLGVDYCSLITYDADIGMLKWKAVQFPEGKNLLRPRLTVRVDETHLDAVISSGKASVLDRTQLEELAETQQIAALMVREGILVSCAIPLRVSGKILGVLEIGTVSKWVFSAKDIQLYVEIAGQVSLAAGKITGYRQISALNDKLAGEKVYLEEQLSSEYNFHEIIGQSPAINQVLKQVQLVASSDISVLVLGETGTGKELIARTIHNLSPRSSRTLVKLNCSAIPAGLLESELFGHERGAFTGAVKARTGRVELADKGTLFLDEIGDIPSELQPKLLRVLQEREFERVGSSKTIKTDFRLIAATNRDLQAMVSDRQFREDLFYRLNVFPIMIPPLRERREDIPPLVRYFTQKYAQRMNKTIDTIPNEIMQRLTELPWMGNVRELQNVIERAVLFTTNNRLNVPFGDLIPTKPSSSLQMEKRNSGYSSGSEKQADAILRVLKETGGIIGGPKGAAQQLGIKRTTLLARMKKLEIAVNKSATFKRN